MTDEQFTQLMNKLERVESLLRGWYTNYIDRIPQHLWTDAERLTVSQFQGFENRLPVRKTP